MSRLPVRLTFELKEYSAKNSDSLAEPKTDHEKDRYAYNDPMV